MNIQIVPQRLRSVQCFVWEIFKEMFYSSMETPCLCTLSRPQANKNMCLRVCHKKACMTLLRAHKHLYEYLFSCKDCSDCKISADKSPLLTALQFSRPPKSTQKLTNSTLLYRNTRNPKTELFSKDKPSTVLITNKTKIKMDSQFLIFFNFDEVT